MAKRAEALLVAAPLFAALGDETRLRLVVRLCDDGPMSITRLTEDANVTRQAVTKHLRLMKDAGVVSEEKRGREVVWRLEPRQIALAREHLARISQHWDDAIERLRAFVEDDS